MWPRNPPLAQELDLRIPDFPPRSRLYCLPPAGLGTPRIEGLLSYVVRLARAHCVNPRHLVRTEFAAVEPAISRLHYASFFTRLASTVDGMGKYAEIFAKAVGRLTGSGGMHALTLLPLKKLLPANGEGLLADTPKWCPSCLAEMSESGDGIFRPLAWAFDLYRVCLRHGRFLEAACPSCGRPQPFIPNYPDLGRCAHCRALLTVRREAEEVKPAPLDRWMSAAIEDIVGHLPALGKTATRAGFLAFLKVAVARHTGGNYADFCESIGLKPWALKGWMSQGKRPSLPKFLSVCYGLDLIPSELFAPNGNGEACLPDIRLRKLPAKPFDRARRPLLSAKERKKLASELDRIVADPADTHPMIHVAKRFSLRRSCLKYWFPDQCEAIHAKYVKARTRRVESQNLADRKKVAQGVREILERGEYPSRRKVNEVMRKHRRTLARSDLLDAYRREISRRYK